MCTMWACVSTRKITCEKANGNSLGLVTVIQYTHPGGVSTRPTNIRIHLTIDTG